MLAKPLLAVNNLYWQVQSKDILKNISFSVETGEFIGVIGTNGSGKTSLLRALYRYTKPTTGHILLQDRDIWRRSASEVAKHIAVVTQTPSALPYLVYDVVAMGLTPHKKLFEGESFQDKELIDTALEQVDLTAFATHQFDTLSGGEQQRALIARAIVQQSQLLIMDEPTNHLDVHYQIDILNRVKKLGKTVIASLHDLNIASAFCDKLILLNHGEIIAYGTPEEVLTQQLISEIYQVQLTVTQHPIHHNPYLMFHYQAGSCQK